MSDATGDPGPISAAEWKRALGEVARQRNEAQQRVEQLLGAIENRKEAATRYCNKCGYFGPGEPDGHHPECDYLAGYDPSDAELFEAAKKVRAEREGSK